MPPKDKAASMPPVYDHLPKKQPRTERYPVCMDDDAVQRLSDAMEAYNAAWSKDDRSEEEVALAEARDAVAASTVVFTLQGRSPRAYDDLVDAHPPTASQLAEAKKRDLDPPAYDKATFAPALVHACLVEPRLPLDEVEAVFSGDEPGWNVAEVDGLFKAALSVNVTRRVVELGKG